jgi:hypothetical protein
MTLHRSEPARVCAPRCCPSASQTECPALAPIQVSLTHASLDHPPWNGPGFALCLGRLTTALFLQFYKEASVGNLASRVSEDAGLKIQ